MIEPLTDRELEILQLLSQGLSNKEIANRLYLAPGTIKAHNHNIFTKLGVSNRTQALLHAQALELLDQVSESEDQLTYTRATTLTNLPRQLLPFVGRKAELEMLADLITDARVALITITGAGGTGKTRLAIEIARHQIDQFPDGVFFASLAHISEPGNIAGAILDSIGLRLQTSISLDQQLFAYLHNKHMLLVLDNFEHLLEGTDFITEILKVSAGIKVLTTSRERLKLSTEVLFVLGGLDYSTHPESGEPPTSSAAQLLLQRAKLSKPDFEPQPDDWPFVQRICQLTEGIPLALILAASWLEMLTLEEISGELTHSIDILESRLRDLPVRQRSMRATIAASWQRLSRQQQQIFANLSVFRDGFTRDAALKVAGADLHELQSLVNRSFITASKGRYEIHEVLRQYGLETLERADLTVDIYTEHSTYYMGFLHQREMDIKGHNQKQGLAEIQADFENIRTAWMWAVEHRDIVAIGLAIDCLSNFAAMQAFLVRVEAIFRHTVLTLAAPDGQTPPPIWDQVTLRHEQTKQRLSLDCNRELLVSILERARARGDDHEAAYCLWVLGNEVLRGRDYTSHRLYTEECLAIWRQLGDEFYTAHALVGICGEDMSPETSTWAIPYLLESAAIRRRIGDQHELSFSLMMIGIRLMYQGAFNESQEYFDQCLALQNESDQTPDFAGILSMKGTLAFLRGDFDSAAECAQAGLDFSQDMNYYGDKSACQALLAFVLSMNGHYTRAFELCRQAGQDLLFDVNAVAIHWGKALACCGLGDDDPAWKALADCLHIARDNLKSPVFQQLCIPLAAVLIARTGESKYAVQLLALTFDQPSAMSGWAQKWSLLIDLRQKLEKELGADAFNAAWDRGPALKLETVVAHLLDNAAR
jgi:predicted ATPase/DNA-binding CsgD family transcriptional regulator